MNLLDFYYFLTLIWQTEPYYVNYEAFSKVIANIMRQSYWDFELVHRIKGIFNPSISPRVAFILTSISNPCTIIYNSVASTLLVTRLHWINDWLIILVLMVESTRYMTKQICDERSWVLANKKSVKTSGCRVCQSGLMHFKTCDLLLICYCSRLFSSIISS